MKLLPGDIFLTNQGGFMSRCIMKVTKFWALDKDADYSHSGIIIGYDGETFESRTLIGRYNISDFIGVPILIGRHRLMNAARFNRGMEQVIRYEGQTYPWWRIALHLFPPLARRVGTGRYLVCSETNSKFLYGCGLLETYRGWTPDNLADMIHQWKLWDIVYEGKFKTGV